MFLRDEPIRFVVLRNLLFVLTGAFGRVAALLRLFDLILIWPLTLRCSEGAPNSWYSADIFSNVILRRVRGKHKKSPEPRPSANAFVSLGILIAAIFVTSSNAASSAPWKNKDWTRWTPQDCKRILTNSPWTSQIVQVFDHIGPYPGPMGPKAVIVSSLAVRQARSVLGLDGSRYTCVTERFDDRIVIRFSEDDLFTVLPDLIVSGRKIPPLPTHRENSATCPIGGGSDISYPKILNGQAVFKPGKNSLSIQTHVSIPSSDNPVEVDTKFRFSTNDMIYKGKPDF
jgi:hypothetical protein